MFSLINGYTYLVCYSRTIEFQSFDTRIGLVRFESL